jgi:hypothetical protein
MRGLFDRGVVRGTITGDRVCVVVRGELVREDEVPTEEVELCWELVLLRICTRTALRLLASDAGDARVESREELCRDRRSTFIPALLAPV